MKQTTTTSTKSATIMSMSTTAAIPTTITTLNTKFSQANYNYVTIGRPSSQLVLKSLTQQSSTKCNNKLLQRQFMSTVNLANKATTTTTTIVAVTMHIKPTTTANTKP